MATCREVQLNFTHPSSSKTFWSKLDELKKNLETIEETNKIILVEKECNVVKTSKITTREEIMAKIEAVVEGLLHDLSEGKAMQFVLDKRGNAKNIRYNSRTGLEMQQNVQKTVVSLANQSSVEKFAVMLKALSMCYNLLKCNKYATKRDLFYMDKPFFGNQNALDVAITDIACLLQVPRNSLHVLASAKGCVAGNLIFKDEEGNYIDCSQTKTGVAVPTYVDDITDFHSKARFVLLVEKEASFQKFVQDQLTTKLGPCILITAKGFPDVNTRIFIKKIWMQLQIPVLALVDADPHGIEIMCVYRYGSMALTFDSENLTCPALRWIGILPTDIHRHGIPKEALIQMNKADHKKIDGLLKRPYIANNIDMQKQLEALSTLGFKAEIECLDAVSCFFASDIYLPCKIRSGDWL